VLVVVQRFGCLKVVIKTLKQRGLRLVLHRENGVNKWLQELKEQDDSNRAKDKRNLMDEVLVSQGFNHQTLGENDY
jgi:hypothetical protein